MYEKSSPLDGVDVLVVENDPDEREMFAIVLSHHGANVAAVGAAEDALAACLAEPPHVLVSDISLPDEDGYSLIRKLRSWAAESGVLIPAVAVTGWCARSDKRRALEAGFQVHLGKPVEVDTLVSVIADLARSRAT